MEEVHQNMVDMVDWVDSEQRHLLLMIRGWNGVPDVALGVAVALMARFTEDYPVRFSENVRACGITCTHAKFDAHV